MPLNYLEPPPNKGEEGFGWTWKKWLYNLYEYVQANMSRDFYFDVSMGRVNGYSVERKFGGVDTASTSWVPVTSSATYQTPTTPQALEAVSTDNTNDVAGGNGARKIRVYGLKTASSTAEEYEDVSLNGTTAVNLVNSWWRIYRLKVIESGTYGSSAAASHNSTITIRDQATSSVVWGQIVSESSFGLGQSEIACYTIPTGKTAYLTVHHIDVSGKDQADVAFFVRENADDISSPYSAMQVKEIELDVPAGTELHIEDKGPLLTITGPADMGWMTRKSGTGNAEVEASFELIIVDN